MAVAHRLYDRVWSTWFDAAGHLGDTARLDALVRSLDEVDVRLDGVWRDPVTFLEPVADTVAFAMYWQPPREEELITADPQVRAALRPLAAAIAGAPATAWWNSPVDLNALRSTHWVDDHSPTPALTGAATNLLKWREQTVAQNLTARSNRPPRPSIQYSGTWWSAPTMASLVSTTRPLANLGAIQLSWHEDSMGFQDATIWSLETVRPPKVWEITQPQAWVDLVQTYPLDVTYECRDDWQRTTGREGTWYIPDWNAVATDWDAVHLSVAGYLTTATRALPLADGDAATMLAGWNPDQTWWLTDILRSKTHPDEWHRTEEPTGEPNWRRLSP
jgi:hypothetical protein